jgi:hypothetical protein
LSNTCGKVPGLFRLPSRNVARFDINRLINELMLAHKPVGMSEEEFVYNRAAYMERRREIAEDWAELIMALALPAVEVLDGPRPRFP